MTVPVGGGGSNCPLQFFIQIYNGWYVFGKPLGSTSIICKKMANFQKSKYLLQNLVIKQKMSRIKKLAQIRKNYKLLKSPWPSEFKCARTLAKFLIPKWVFKKNWKFPLKNLFLYILSLYFILLSHKIYSGLLSLVWTRQTLNSNIKWLLHSSNWILELEIRH